MYKQSKEKQRKAKQSKATQSKMVLIEVEPIIINALGIIDSFGDETGTPEFYTVKHVLEKYLGKDIYVSWNYEVFTFEVQSYEEEEMDEGYDASEDFIEVIESIHESFFDTHYYNGHQLQFKIVRVVE